MPWQRVAKELMEKINWRNELSFAKTPSAPEMARFALRFGLKRARSRVALKSAKDLFGKALGA
jgi:hypothetical protein